MRRYIELSLISLFVLTKVTNELEASEFFCAYMFVTSKNRPFK